MTNPFDYKEFHDRNARLARGDVEILIRNGDVTNAVERYLGMDNEEQAVDYAERLRFFMNNAVGEKHGDLLYRIFMSLLDDTLHRLELKKEEHVVSLEDRNAFYDAAGEILKHHSVRIQEELRGISTFDAMFGENMLAQTETNNINFDCRTTFDKQGQYLSFSYDFKANIISAE